MTNATQLKRRILSRIYIIYAMRRVLAPFMLKVYIALVLFWQLLIHISLMSVVKNAPGFDVETISFFTQAFVTTGAGIKVIVVVGFIISAWLMKDIIASVGMPLLGKLNFRVGERERLHT